MLKILRVIAVCCAIFAPFFSQAQDNNIYTSGSGTKHDKLMDNDAFYKTAQQQLQQNYADYLKKNKGGRPDATKAVVTVPVVFHVVNPDPVGNPANFNPTDAQIDAALLFMNQSFNKTRTGSCGVDTEIQFVKAARTPTGAATTGIVRVDGSGVTNYATNGISAGGASAASESTVKNLSKWDQASYINIWIVKAIEGFTGYTVGTSGIAGYAYRPPIVQSINSPDDGIVVLASQIISTTGRTLTHEMGHYLGLQHTFEGDFPTGTPVGTTVCPSNANCATDGDMICDTEAHRRTDAVGISCPNPGNMVLNTCTGMNFVVAADGCSVLNNYMSYSSNLCRNQYTAGQKALMQSVLAASGLRSGLTTSLGGVAPGNCPVAATCGYTPPSRGLYGLGSFSIGSTINIKNNLTAQYELTNYIDHSCTQQVTLTAGTSASVSMTSLFSADYRIYIDYNNNGTFEASELVYTDANANSSSGSFTLATGGPYNTPLRMRVIADRNLVDACSSTGGGQAEDFAIRLLNPAPVSLISFTGKATENRSVELKWQTTSETNSSHFIIERSQDLKNYEQVTQLKSGGNTTETQQYTTIDFNPFAGTNYYRLTEYSFSGVPQSFKPIAVEVSADQAGTYIYPNPSDGLIFVKMPQSTNGNIEFRLSSVMGAELPFKAEKNGSDWFRLLPQQKLAAGTYFLTVRTDNAKRTLKVIVQN